MVMQNRLIAEEELVDHRLENGRLNQVVTPQIERNSSVRLADKDIATTAPAVYPLCQPMIPGHDKPSRKSQR
jgi:hypothetical protein